LQVQGRPRWNVEQLKAKKLKDRHFPPNYTDTDDGGHFASAETYGPSEQINYFSQNPNQNQPRTGNQFGLWREMEQNFLKFRRDFPDAIIKVEMVPEYAGTKRPISVGVFVTATTRSGQPVTLPSYLQPRYNIPNP
jgi:hypothetical protein